MLTVSFDANIAKDLEDIIIGENIAAVDPDVGSSPSVAVRRMGQMNFLDLFDQDLSFDFLLIIRPVKPLIIAGS